jgi:hypothetical protein
VSRLTGVDIAAVSLSSSLSSFLGPRTRGL